MAGNYSNTGSWVPNVYSPGLRNVGSYQVSGTPHITVVKFPAGETSANYGLRVQFPYVTSRVVVFHAHANRTNDVLKVAFQSASAGNVISGHHFMQVQGDHSFLEMDVKCKEIYVYAYADGNSATTDTPATQLKWVTVYAELTNIPTSSMFHLTGSGITE